MSLPMHVSLSLPDKYTKGWKSMCLYMRYSLVRVCAWGLHVFVKRVSV